MRREFKVQSRILYRDIFEGGGHRRGSVVNDRPVNKYVTTLSCRCRHSQRRF